MAKAGSKKTIRCGIIGCGVISPVHAASYQMQDGVEVTWACDLVETKARKLAEKFNIPNVTTDYHQLLAAKDVDCVSICTDHASHAPIAVAAMDAGKHVLCEKALAANAKGLDAMLAASAKHPELVFCGVFQHRFDKANRVVRRLIQSGAFGDLLTAAVHVRCLRSNEYYRADQWRGTWDLEGGAVLINQAIHFLDSMLWMTGGTSAVCGAYANLTHGDVMETEDTVVASFRLKSGALATMEATCSSHISWEPTIEIHGTVGGIELRGEKVLKVDFADKAAGEKVAAELAGAIDEKKIDAGKRHYGTTHPEQVADVIAAIRTGRAPEVPVQSAAHTVRTVFAIYESHRKNKWINVAD